MIEQVVETETALISRAVAGDNLAMDALIANYHQQLLSLIERLFPRGLSDWLDPADIVQDTYTVAFNSIRTFQPQGDNAFFRWLATIARTQIMDQIKASKRFKRQGERLGHRESEISDVLNRVAIYKRTPSESAAGHELLAKLERSIGQLPYEQQQALRLRHEEGLSPGEAAQRMQRRVGAAQMIYFRALKNLREKIGATSL